MAENAHRFFYALSRHFLDGLSGLSPVFQTFYIQVWNKYDTLVPHPAYIYFIKIPANPDNPSRFVFFPPWRAVFLVFQNALVFKSKRTCVSSQTSLRFKSNALAFFCLPICLKIRNGFQLDLYVWVALYVGRILNIIIFKFQF